MATRALGNEVAVQFVVITPDADPQQPAQVYAAFSTDGWRPGGRKIPRVASGVYSATFQLPAEQVIEYKFTREPGWVTVEKGEDGGEMPNRSLRVPAGRAEVLVLHRVARWADRGPDSVREVIASTATGEVIERKSTLTGDIRAHHLFHSPQLKNARTILVYLPPGYDSDLSRRYPVLYMHDGNNVFDAKTSFTGVEWGADETAQRLIEEGQIDPLIIVAMYNTTDRVNEYTPFKHEDIGGGDGDAYLAWIIEDVKPFIDKTYRTQPDRAHTAICGSSLGGLISLYAAYRHPEVYSGAGVVSPALFWADGRIIDYVRHAKPQIQPRIWLDIGSEEGSSFADEQAEERWAARHCKNLVEVFEQRGMRSERDYHFEVIEGGRHHESDWAARFDRILRYLFPKTEAE